MRLCFIGHPQSVHTQRWLQYFVDRGHDVHLITYAPAALAVPGLIVHPLMAGPPARPSSAAADTAPGGLYDRVRQRLPYGLRTLRVGMQWLVRGLRRTVRAIHPDILHGHFVIDYGWYAALAGYAPLVVSTWGSDVLLHPRRSVISRQIVGYTLRHSQLVHALSRDLADAVRAFGVPQERVLVAPLGVEDNWLTIRAMSVTPDRPVLVSTRVFHEVYNLPTLLRAVDHVRRRHPGVRLRLTSDGPLRGQLEALVAELGLHPHVEFLGWLSRDRLRAAIAGADIYVSTSWSDGSSVSLLEAMAAGLTPVVSDIPGNREWITHGENGLLADPHDVESVARALEQAITQPDWRRSVAQRNAAVIRERALWSTQMQRVEQAYEALRQ